MRLHPNQSHSSAGRIPCPSRRPPRVAPQTKREAIESQINYLESHSSRTHYGRYRQEGLFIGSGVVDWNFFIKRY